MTDYANWKIKKEVVNYSGNDEAKQIEAEYARIEYKNAADWCNVNDYHIESVGDFYKTVKNPEPVPPTHEQIRQLRIEYRRTHIDDQTAERSRKMANDTWTEEDEQEYLQLDAEVTAWIEKNLPYPE